MGTETTQASIEAKVSQGLASQQAVFDSTISAYRIRGEIVALLKRDDYSTTVKFYGIAPHGSADTDMAWQVRRVLINGTQEITEYAANGAYTQRWSDRATLFPAPSFVNAKSVQFDGANDYVNVADNVSLQFDRLNTMTLSAWIKTVSTAAGVIVQKKDTANQRGYELMLESNGKITFELRNVLGNRIQVTTTAATVNDGLWHHVVITYDGSSTAAGVKIYKDGVSQAITVGANTLTLTTISAFPLRIGQNEGSGENFFGNIDEVSIWDVNMSAANVLLLYNAGVPTDISAHPDAASRRAWWRMGDNDVFPLLLDVVGGNTGTMTNMTAGDIETEVAP